MSDDVKVRNARAKIVRNEEEGTVSVVPAGADSACTVVALTDLPGGSRGMKGSIVWHLALLGLGEKLRDSYAKGDVSVAEATKEVAEAMMKGEWAAKGKGESAAAQKAEEALMDFAAAYATHFRVGREKAHAGLVAILESGDAERVAKLEAVRTALKKGIAAAKARRLAEKEGTKVEALL